jgi:branched-chain amino acid transport system ATP-binding protein
MRDAVLELEHVVAGYGETHILHDLSLSLRKGERVAMIGRNGVGKTTTLSTIMGLTRQHGGSIRLNGLPIDRLAPHKRARLGLGLVPQTRDIFPSLSVEENLIAGVRNTGRLEEAYELFPRLWERRSNGGRQLSGGEQQMLSIARALMGAPEILLLDEPLEGLAPVICEMLLEAFQKLSGRGHTIVLVEQHTALALEFAERVFLIEQGTVAWEGRAAELKSNNTLLERHLGIAMQN